MTATVAVPRAPMRLVLRFMLDPLPGVRFLKRAPVSPLLPVGHVGDQLSPDGSSLAPCRPEWWALRSHTAAQQATSTSGDTSPSVSDQTSGRSAEQRNPLVISA